MVKLLSLIDIMCCLILLLVICIKALPGPGLHTNNLLPCTSWKVNAPEVSFNNLTRIVILDGYAKVDCYGHKIASITGGFGILEIDPNSVHLNLSSVSNKYVISVFTNNTDVEVQLQSQDRLLITPIRRENHWEAGLEEYEVRVRSIEGLEDKIIISTTTNGRKVKIDVNYEPDKTTDTFSALEILTIWFVLGIFWISLFGVLIKWCVREEWKVEAFPQDGLMIKKCV